MDAIQFKACYEAPYFDRKPILPWKITERRPFSACFVDGAMTFEDIGLFVIAFAQYGLTGRQGISDMDKDEIVALILEREGPVVAGGLAVLSDDSGGNIFPGCCCGLEGWREWVGFEAEGYSPWWGHDPSPWMERTDQGTVQIWQDGGMDDIKSKSEYFLEIEVATYASKMKQVEQDMLGFLEVLQSWAEHEGISQPERLVGVVDKAFDIRPKYMQTDWWQKSCQ